VFRLAPWCAGATFLTIRNWEGRILSWCRPWRTLRITRSAIAARSAVASHMPIRLRIAGHRRYLRRQDRCCRKAGERVIEAKDFFRGPLTTVLTADEIITDIRFPVWLAKRRFGFCEFARRRGDFALAGAAVFYDEDCGKVANAHVGAMGVSDRPLRLGAVEEALNGISIGDADHRASGGQSVSGHRSARRYSRHRGLSQDAIRRHGRARFAQCAGAISLRFDRSRLMTVARHPRPKELEGVSLEEIMKKYVGRFKEKKPDWAAFEDAKIEGFKRAQHRFIGAGGSGKHGDPTVIPAGNFTLSVMYVEPGQGNAAHTHEVEECFFVLDGYLDVFVEDDGGKRLTTRLGPWECICCPAGVIHGYQNDSLGPVYFQVMLGRGKPETMAMPTTNSSSARMRI